MNLHWLRKGLLLLPAYPYETLNTFMKAVAHGCNHVKLVLLEKCNGYAEQINNPYGCTPNCCLTAAFTPDLPWYSML
jgi:hypothetical protein